MAKMEREARDLDARAIERLREFDRAMDAWYLNQWQLVYSCCRMGMNALVVRNGLTRVKALFEENNVACEECGIIWSDFHAPFQQRPDWAPARDEISSPEL